MWVTNIGCDHWEGAVSAQTSPDQVDVPQETITATKVLFTRYHPAGMDTGELAFRLESADVSWTMSGQVRNCTFSGSQSWRQTPANGIGGLLDRDDHPAEVLRAAGVWAPGGAARGPRCLASHARNSPYQWSEFRGFRIQWFSSG